MVKGDTKQYSVGKKKFKSKSGAIAHARKTGASRVKVTTFGRSLNLSKSKVRVFRGRRRRV